MDNSSKPVISFIARSGAGKTTLLEKVIAELKTQGFRVAVIKHDAHDFEMDIPGKDTWRLGQAGADVVAISSPKKNAFIEKVEVEKTLDELIARVPGNVDIILTEGFKRSGKPAVEVFRSEVHSELLGDPKQLVAIASDIRWDVGVPCYGIDDVGGIVSEIINYMQRYTGR